MTNSYTPSTSETADAVFQADYGSIVASLIRVFRDFDLAEEAIQDAFTVALATWPRDGVPSNPVARIITTAKRRAIDRVRRKRVRGEKYSLLTDRGEFDEGVTEILEDAARGILQDDWLRLIFTCCHPALNMEARVALTLRTLGGLTTHEIARAFLVPEATLAQRRKAPVSYNGRCGRAIPDHTNFKRPSQQYTRNLRLHQGPTGIRS